MGSVPIIKELFEILECKVTNFPFKYLLLPLEALFNSKAIWNVVVEKVERRLASWKNIYLSK